MRKIRVGVVTFRDLNRAGGTAIRVIGITKFLKDYGCEPILFSLWDLPEELKGIVEFVKISKEKFVGFASLLSTYSPRIMTLFSLFLKEIDIVKKISQKRVDIIHCHQHHAGYQLLSIKKHIKIPILFDEHGIISLQKDDFTSIFMNKILLSVYLRAEKNLFTKADGLVVPSEREKDFVIHQYKIPEKQVYVIPDGVDIDFFSQKIDEENLECIKRKYNLQGKKVILFAGAFKKLGGILDLLKAFKILSKYRNNIKLILIGRGILYPDIKAFIARHRLQNIVLVGAVDHSELPKYQRIANVLVVPEVKSEYNEMEPHIKLLECLASGKPTVATNLISAREIVKEGKNGILVEPNNPEAMALGIRRLLEDDELRERIGKNGQLSIPKSHFWRTSAEKSVAAYGDILRRHKEEYD